MSFFSDIKTPIQKVYSKLFEIDKKEREICKS